MKLRLLSAGDVRAAIDMSAAIEAMRSAFSQLSSGSAIVPLRGWLSTPGGTTLLMPAFLGESDGLGMKIVSGFEGNAQRGLPTINALVVMLDADTGEPRAVIEGAYLTALRTAAGSGLATELLAEPDASVLAVFGAGAQARSHIEAMRAVRPVREIRIASRTRDSAERLARELEGIDIRVCDDPAAAVDGAELIVTATTSRKPVFPAAALAEGAHINAVGTFSHEGCEIEGEVVLRSRLVVDSREAVLREAGDVHIRIAEGLFGPDHIDAELGEIVNGARPEGRMGHEFTLFKSVGNAAQDVAAAAEILRVAELEGLGTTVEL